VQERTMWFRFRPRLHSTEHRQPPAFPAARKAGGFDFPPLTLFTTALLLAAILLIGGVLAFAVRNARHERVGIPQARAIPPADSAQLATPLPLAQSVSDLDAFVAPLKFWQSFGLNMTFVRKTRFMPPINPVDTRTFESDGHIVVIADMETPAFETVCKDTSRYLWACGLQARAQLFNRIRTGVLECRPKTTYDALGKPVPSGWMCQHNGEDVALWMIRTGWARPASGSPLHYAEAASEAQREGRGLWNGGWNVVAPQLAPPRPPDPGAKPAARKPRQGQDPR
jgi:endonuclease YncB( thermonuclease family)